ncbi:MAG: hypothetical protein L3J39_14680, partial [Verrucomicrobiales bacterium]|nr:hypothetical protein [Verrucomicrobiales bacterium]
LPELEKDILKWCEDNELDLPAKKCTALTNSKTWEKQKRLLDAATQLLEIVGTEESSNFNEFKTAVDAALKENKIKLTASEKNVILAAVSWYDESAEKVIKRTEKKLTGDKLKTLLDRLDCSESDLPDFGYFPTGTKGEYIIYEAEGDLRDSETVPLKEKIHAYYLREVKPHVEEAWIDLEKTKIGYEISFNKYFYQHKPLRSLEAVTADILELEKANEGLIAEILNSGNR